MDEKYIEVAFQQYTGDYAIREKLGEDLFTNIINWMNGAEERAQKQREWEASPEGQAHLKRQRKAREKRERFAKRWQLLHDWLVKNGVECDHDQCY